jgi:hypothetical protein
MANIEFFEDLALNQAETLHPVSRKILHFMGEV